MTAKKVISVRMDLTEMAKARDGLIDKGIEPSQLDNVSQILRLTFYYGLLTLCDNPKAPPTEESLAYIRARMLQKGEKVTLNDIIKDLD